MIPASPSVSRLIRRDLGSCSHFPCRAELFGWLATSLAEGLLAGATSEQVPQTNKTQKSLNQVLWIIRKIGLVCWKRDRLTCVLGLHLSFLDYVNQKDDCECQQTHWLLMCLCLSPCTGHEASGGRACYWNLQGMLKLPSSASLDLWDILVELWWPK